MNFFQNILLISLALVPFGSAKVNVTVYYESLCPDSVRFIGAQLQPNYQKLKDHINLELVPFGKASQNNVNGQWKFQCQHGPNECKGNKYQSCVLAVHSKEEKLIDLINCIMRERDPFSLLKIEKCTNKFSLNWENIENCATSEKGDELLAKSGEKTLNLEPNLSFVPTIVFNEKFDQNLQNLALIDFVAAVCKNIIENKPSLCDGKESIDASRSLPDYFLYK